MLSLIRLGRRTHIVDDGSWKALLGRLADELGIRRRVQLRVGACQSVPLVWGVWPWAPARILVPGDARDWSDDRRQCVLWHELAHIKRCDCLTQLITQITCAMYWFNPLIWFGRQRMLIERERACVDIVLSRGAQSADYAQHILEIAAGPQPQFLAAFAGIAMARRSRIESRLLAILDANHNRRALTRLGVMLAALLFAGLTVPLSIMRAADSPDRTPSPDKPASNAFGGPGARPNASAPGRRSSSNSDQSAVRVLDDHAHDAASKVSKVLVMRKGGAAVASGEFVTVSGHRASKKTTAMVSWHDDALIVRFECEDDLIIARPRNRDDPDLWKDDSVEVFLDFGHHHNLKKDWYHLIVSASGSIADERTRNYGFDAKGVSAKVSRTTNGWAAELVIPWDSLGVRPKPGDIWGLNLNREQADRDGEIPAEFQCWSPTIGLFHNIHHWGHIVFAEAGADVQAVRQQIAEQHASLAKEMVAPHPIIRTVIGENDAVKGPLEALVARKGKLIFDVVDGKLRMFLPGRQANRVEFDKGHVAVYVHGRLMFKKTRLFAGEYMLLGDKGLIATSPEGSLMTIEARAGKVKVYGRSFSIVAARLEFDVQSHDIRSIDTNGDASAPGGPRPWSTFQVGKLFEAVTDVGKNQRAEDLNALEIVVPRAPLDIAPPNEVAQSDRAVEQLRDRDEKAKKQLNRPTQLDIVNRPTGTGITGLFDNTGAPIPPAAMSRLAPATSAKTVALADRPAYIAGVASAADVLTKMAEARKNIRTAVYTLIRQQRHAEGIDKATPQPYRREAQRHPWPATGVVVPPDTLVIHKERLAISGKKYRYDTEGALPSSRRGQVGLVVRKSSLAFDGEKVRSYTDGSTWASVTSRQRSWIFTLPVPLMELHYGLLTITPDPKRLKLTGQDKWKGRNCYILSEQIGPLRKTYYIDPERNWTVIRETREVVAPAKRPYWHDRATKRVYSLDESNIEIDYKRHESGHWLPSAWTIHSYRGWGKERILVLVNIVTVTEAKLNEAIADGTFKIEFPDGVKIYDRDIRN